MCLISSLQAGHCSAIAHKTSSKAPSVCWSGSAQHWANKPTTCLSQPSSLASVTIHGWARTQPPSACRPSLHSSAVSSQLSSQLELIFRGPGLEPESRALRRKRRAVEKNLLWPASPEPRKHSKEKNQTLFNNSEITAFYSNTTTLQNLCCEYQLTLLPQQARVQHPTNVTSAD